MSNIRSKSGSNKIELVILDLASLDSVRECAKKIQEKETKIDYLINNAGKRLNRDQESSYIPKKSCHKSQELIDKK